MRCGRAQRLMAVAVDGELAPRERETLDRHLTICPTCEREMRATSALLGVLGSLPGDAAVPLRLERETLRRIRGTADEAGVAPRAREWRSFVPVPALALAAALVIALSVALLRRAGEAPVGGHPAARVAGTPASTRSARTMVARAARPARTPAEPAPAQPPPALAAAPDLFVDLPILRHLEKLEHYDAIRTTTLDDGPTGTGARQGDSG